MTVAVPISSREPSTPDMKLRRWFVVVDDTVQGLTHGHTWFEARANAMKVPLFASSPLRLVRGQVL